MGRYGHVAGYFNERGLDVMAIDHACHGGSEGMKKARGYLPSFNVLVNNLADFVVATVAPRPEPQYFYAHSTGGLVAFLALKNDLSSDNWPRFQGAVYSGPLLRTPLAALYACGCFVRCLAGCCPGCVLPAVKPGQLSKYARAEIATRNDDLYWGWNINLSFGESWRRAVVVTGRTTARFDCATLRAAATRRDRIHQMFSKTPFVCLPSLLPSWVVALSFGGAPPH